MDGTKDREASRAELRSIAELRSMQDSPPTPQSSLTRVWGATTRTILRGGNFDAFDEDGRRRILMIHVIVLIAIGNLLPLGLRAALGGHFVIGFLDFLFAGVLGALILFVRRTGYYALAARFGVTVGGALFIFLFASGGVQGTGHLWLYTFPLLASFLLGAGSGAAASILLLLLSLATIAVGPLLSFMEPAPYSREFLFRFVPSFLVVAAYSYVFERLRSDHYRRLTDKNRELGIAFAALQDKEYDLERAQEKLEKRVGERTSELNQANVDLQTEVHVRTAAEDELRRSHERFTTVVDSMEAWVFAADLETHELLFMNRPMRETFGERVGEPCWAVLRGETEECADCPNNRLIEKQGQADAMISWMDRNPVSRTWCLHHARASQWVDGRPVRVQISTDITKRKEAMEENSRLQVELLQSQKMEALGTLAGGVAHDLNNLLSAVVNYPELLLADLPEDDRMRRPLERIRESGEKSARLVTDLLALTRRGVADTELVNLNQVVTGLLRSPEYERLQQEHPEMEFQATLDPSLREIRGSPHHLETTLLNLVSNALEAMGTGGRLTLATRHLDTEEPIRGYMTVRPGSYAVLTVGDTGPGIPPDIVSRIFEPFFTTKTMGRSGTGLGMAVVWANLQDHGGCIDVITKEGEGASMVVYLPVAQATEDEDRAAPEESFDYRGRGEVVLIVDDEPEHRELAHMILSRHGYRPHAVDSGEAALTYLDSNLVDLLVLDMCLEPGINGLTTWQRAIAIQPALRAVITTGKASTEPVKPAQELGAGPCVKKPYLIRELALAVRTELDRPVDATQPVSSQS